MGADPVARVEQITATTRKPNLYVLTTGIVPRLVETSRAIVAMKRSAPDWEEVPPEPEFLALTPIHTWKFVRHRSSETAIDQNRDVVKLRGTADH